MTVMQTVVETPEFLRRAGKAGIAESGRDEIVNFLAANPDSGISLGGGLRKVRISRPGGGKSGGYRVVYFFRDTKLPLFLLTMFAKNEKANLMPGERKELIILCNQIANSYGKRT